MSDVTDSPPSPVLAGVLAAPDAVPRVDPRSRAAITLYLALAGALAILHLLVIEKFGPLARLHRPIVDRALLAGALVAGVLAVTRALDAFVVDRLASMPARYNLRHVTSLVRTLVIGIIVVSTLFATWYTALVSLGILSLVLGFALQTPITSFIGWIYIVAKSPYRVGDRVRVGDAAGDVIDVSFLDTIVWEIGGPLVSTDEPSGRIIRVPNSLALSSAIYNYSAAHFPYVWNEVKVLIAYGSDLEFVAHAMQSAAARHQPAETRERLAALRRAVARTPIDPRALHDRPAVVFRSHESSWLEATVRYLVAPRDAAEARAQITREVLRVLGDAPDRVMFPAGAER